MPLHRTVSLVVRHAIAAFAIVVVTSVDAGCLVLGAGHPKPIDGQRDLSRALDPGDVGPTSDSPAAHAPELGVLRVRAYVDDAFTASTRDPDARLREMIEDASAILHEQIGVSIELVDTKPFTPAGRELPAILDEVRHVDDARDVDVVLGVVASQPIVTTSLHVLGYADVLGRYAVVRALDDVRERQAIERALNRLPDDQRDSLLERRRRHKAAIVLLHEIAHCLGGVHVDDPTMVLFPAYSVDQMRVDDDALALLTIGFEWHHAKTDDERAALAGKLADALDVRRARFEGTSVDAALSSFRSRAHNASPGSSSSSSSIVLPPNEARTYNEAVTLAQKNDAIGAWSKLAPIATAKAEAPIQVLACALSSMDGVVVLDAKARCERALASSQDLEAVIASIDVANKTHDDDLRAHAFSEATTRLSTSTPNAAAFQIALRALNAKKIALAEDALAKSTDPRNDEMRTKITQTRRRNGLARGAVKPDDEAAVLDEIASLFDAINKAPNEVIKRVDDDITKFGAISGLLALKCEALGQARKIADAEKACSDAVAHDDNASIAHALLGVVEGERGRVDDAVKELNRAIELDPANKTTWTALRMTLTRSKRKQALADLEQRYQAQFAPK